jgi:hypothetical protein
MKTQILKILAVICGFAGAALGVIALMFAGSGIMRISDGAAVALSAVLALFSGLAAFLYIRAFFSFRKSPDAANSTDILVGIAFILWVSLTALPKFPDSVPLLDYNIPKSIFILVIPYAFYRVSKMALIRK